MNNADLFCLEDLQISFSKVKARGGALADLLIDRDLDQYLLEILGQLNNGYYIPDPVKQYIRIKHPASKEQLISILTVRDRIVQQALVNIISPLFEPDFSDCSYAYRSGRSALSAAARVEQYITEGNCWVLETDVANFFQSMDHSYLLERIEAKVTDCRLIKLVQLFITAPAFREMTFYSTEEGINIGGIISPLLSNIYLHQLDVEMELAGYNYLRYSDDLVVLGLHKEEMQQALKSVKDNLKKIKLSINRDKTRICHINEGFNFLGFRFDLKGRGPAVKAIDSLKQNIAIILGRNDLLEAKISDLLSLLQGWRNYYGLINWLIPQDQLTALALVKMAVADNDQQWADNLLKARQKLQFDSPQVCCLLAEEWLKFGWEVEALFELGKAIILDTAYPPVFITLNKILPVNSEQLKVICDQIKVVLAEPYCTITLYELSESLAKCGCFRLAQAVHARATGFKNAPQAYLNFETAAAGGEIEEVPEIVFTEKGVEKYLSLFCGREDLYAYEEIPAKGKRVFTTIKKPMTEEVVSLHLKGNLALAAYLLRENHTLRMMVIDIDVSKKLLIEHQDRPEYYSSLLELAQADANRIKNLSGKLGINVYLEDSGYRGRHCWFFFQEPVLARKARLLARLIMSRAGAPSSGITWELFPGTDRIKNNHSLHRIKLPLGIHPISGRRSCFVDEIGHPIPDQAGYFQLIKAIDKDKLDQIIALEEKTSGSTDLTAAPFAPVLRVDSVLVSEARAPLVKLVVNNCALIKHLVQKAESTKYLPHADRQALLLVLGHLGEEGRGYLHRVISFCLNYDRLITQKYIDRLPSKPISCARLRERYQQLSASLPCSCTFGRISNTYPSPVLHALKAGSADVKQVTKPMVEMALPEVIKDEKVELEAVLLKMQNLRRQQQGIGKSLEKCEQFLTNYFDEAKVDRLPVNSGTLVRIACDDGKVKWIIEI